MARLVRSRAQTLIERGILVTKSNDVWSMATYWHRLCSCLRELCTCALLDCLRLATSTSWHLENRLVLFTEPFRWHGSQLSIVSLAASIRIISRVQKILFLDILRLVVGCTFHSRISVLPVGHSMVIVHLTNSQFLGTDVAHLTIYVGLAIGTLNDC